MKKNLLNVKWENIQNYDDKDISYFLFLEGKDLEAISKIRNLDKIEVQNHIIEGKIRYRFLAKNSSVEELFTSIYQAGKEDRKLFLKFVTGETKEKLINYIKSNYADMPPKSKERAVWILGELKDGVDILKKASVHKFTSIRRLAVSAMGKIGHKDCEIALIRALDDENPQVVLYAIKALNKLNSQLSLTKLKEIEDKWNKEYISRAVDEYINRMES
ncbi:HEAT repeat domain-containing protein [Haloimpatiens massiliensis]|uniref:HEAT repeat domain-containing protein n=1 Tax=Haloimpatiens massiliensis TaxID=1658110 RepID=UPI000C83E354|nr:HEAT repeat domain-containing protein [Haloimpatiens massiliensis]